MHTLLVGDKVPFFKKLNTNKALHVQCDLLKEEADVVRWVTYCHKEENNRSKSDINNQNLQKTKRIEHRAKRACSVSPPVIGVLYSGGHAG